MILLIDNYDSFVHNLARYFRRLGQETLVVRNDAIDVAEIRQLCPQAIVLSPGPCTPNQAGCSLQIVRELARRTPILGVCLGHQTIGQACGGTIVRAPLAMHGRLSSIEHTGTGVFADLPHPLTVCRYHSLMIDPQTRPANLEVTAQTADGVIMAIQHCELPLFGVQFHPEAILTEGGYLLLANFLRISGVVVPELLPAIESERPKVPTCESFSPWRPVAY